MSIRKIVLIALISPALVVAVAVGILYVNRKPPSVNVLLVTIDTLRRDHCSAYGYQRKTTPVLDRLAAEGVIMENAYAVSSTTAPSHATLFTGKYPLTHGIMKNGHALDNELPVLTEKFRDAGYQTAAFVSSFVLNGKFGFARGFDEYEDRFHEKGSSVNWKKWQGNKVEGGFDRRAEGTTEAALEWLGKMNPDRPFFVWIHYFDPHAPYDPPEATRNRFVPAGSDPAALETQIGRYDEEILFTDTEFGRIVKRLEEAGVMKDTMIVATSDHGEGLMQHGRMGHGRNLYEEAVRVPMIFHWPQGIPAGRRIQGNVGLIDLCSTIAEFAGLAVTPSDGISLVKNITGNVPVDADRRIYLHRRRFASFQGDMFGLRWNQWKYVEAAGEGIRELYNLSSDPGENTSLVDSSAGQAQAMATEIGNWEKTRPRAKAQQELSEEDRERLEALGYIQ